MAETSETERRRLEEEAFFVGYFPMQGGQLRFAWAAAAVTLGLVLAGGAAAALFQRNPGEGLSPYQTGQSLTGVLVEAPYPMLRTREPNGDIRHVLLVTGSKFVWRLPQGAVGQAATLRGNLLERDGHRMLEVFGRQAADSEAGLAELARLEPQPVGAVTLEGEIVDSKCYFGRMRPGGGRTHRACAQLCLAGGIPPVFVTRGPGGETFFVLTTASGEPATDAVLPFVAEPVRVRGSLARLGSDLRVLALDFGGIERL